MNARTAPVEILGAADGDQAVGVGQAREDADFVAFLEWRSYFQILMVN